MDAPLEHASTFWLTFQKRCQIVLQQRTPRHHLGYSHPDVLGITPARFMCEIECKRTVSDFKRDSEKSHVQFRIEYLHRWPKWFYYCIPHELLEKVKPLCPEWAGLMYVQGVSAFVEKVSPTNPKSSRLSLLECCRLTKLLAYQVISQQGIITGLANRWQECDWGRDYDI